MIAAGASHTCALSEGSAICWGAWHRDEEGRRDTFGIPGSFTSIAAGGNTTCATSADGEVYCWGDNDRGATGQFDDGVPVEAATRAPTVVPIPEL